MVICHFTDRGSRPPVLDDSGRRAEGGPIDFVTFGGGQPPPRPSAHFAARRLYWQSRNFGSPEFGAHVVGRFLRRYPRPMATVTRTYLVDDLDGSTDDVETVHFSLDKTDFEIDLSAGNAARLRENLERFIEAGHRIKESRRGVRKQVITTGAVSKEQTQAIRHWAKENGYQVSERGRIPSTIRAAFESAH